MLLAVNMQQNQQASPSAAIQRYSTLRDETLWHTTGSGTICCRSQAAMHRARRRSRLGLFGNSLRTPTFGDPRYRCVNCLTSLYMLAHSGAETPRPVPESTTPAQRDTNPTCVASVKPVGAAQGRLCVVSAGDQQESSPCTSWLLWPCCVAQRYYVISVFPATPLACQLGLDHLLQPRSGLWKSLANQSSSLPALQCVRQILFTRSCSTSSACGSSAASMSATLKACQHPSPLCSGSFPPRHHGLWALTASCATKET